MKDILNKSNLIWLIVIIAGVVILWNMGILNFSFNKTSKQDNIIKENTAKIDSLRGVISDLQVNQAKYDSAVTDLKSSLVSIETEINDNETKIKDLKKKYNEKINSISGYSTQQLEEFLSNRYK